MGILRDIAKKADELDKIYNPLRKAGDIIEKAATPDTSSATPEQKAYEAKELAANKNNPSYGATVKVDDSIKKVP
jgi:hypothetical protein